LARLALNCLLFGLKTADLNSYLKRKEQILLLRHIIMSAKHTFAQYALDQIKTTTTRCQKILFLA
jgi:hypothetical protein